MKRRRSSGDPILEFAVDGQFAIPARLFLSSGIDLSEPKQRFVVFKLC
jgi:hypothetical protein